MSESKVDWEAVAAKLPTERTTEHIEERKKLFEQFDPNGNGYLSLAEVDAGILAVLRLEALFNCKPAIMRAFQAAKDIAGVAQEGKDTTGPGADFVEKSEFRLLLVYLVQYFMLRVMFDAIDTSEDGTIDKAEFTTALEKISDWGLPLEDASAEFDKIDTNAGGKVLFDEFADWALRKKLSMDDSPAGAH